MKMNARVAALNAASRPTASAGDEAPVDGAAALRPLEFNLAYRLSFISAMVMRATGPVISAHGLTNQQWKVMSVLCQIAPATAQEVTRWVTLDKSAVSRTVRSLLELGLIHRKLMARDARHVHLVLTVKGKALHGKVAEKLAGVQADLMQDVPAAAGAALFNSLRLVEDRLRARLQGNDTGLDDDE